LDAFSCGVAARRRGGDDAVVSDLESDPRWVPPTPGDTVDEGRSFAAVARGLFKSAPAAPRVGRYYLLERLGQGGMGVVYVGYDPTLERRVAIKFLKDRKRGGERLLNEGRALANLVHPNVVAVHEVAEDGDGVYLVMAHIEGQTLDVWQREAARPWQEVLRVYVDAGRGLAAVHDVGLAHRDVKPSNLLIDGHGQVRVADFGLAVRVEPGGVEAKGGTEAYMAPEQARGEGVGAAADQYALCLCLLEALVGSRPEGSDPSAWRRSAAQRDPRGDAPPPGLFAALQRGLNSDPDTRHASMRGLLDALDVQRETPRHPAVWLAGGLALGMLGLALGLAVAPEPDGAAEVPPRCAAAEHVFLQTHWTTAQRESVISAERARDPLWSLTLRDLDGYAERWDAVHHDGCVAHDEGRLSAVGLDDRSRCLERLGRDFDGLVRLLGEEVSLPGEGASGAVAGLVRPENCEVPRSVLELTFGGFSEDASEASMALERDIALQWARSRMGLQVDVDLGELETRAHAVEDLALRADVYRFVSEKVSDIDEKRRLNALAVRASLAGRAQVMLAASFIDQGRIAEWSGNLDDATTSFELAGATIDALNMLALDFPALEPDALALDGQRRLAMGNLARRQGRLDDHLADQRAALDLFLSAGLDQPMREAAAWLNVGEAHRLLGQVSEGARAYTRAIELARPLVSKNDPRLQTMFSNRGAMRQDFGDWAGARADFAQVLKPGELPENASEAQVAFNLALMAAESGDLQEAARGCRGALRPVGPKGATPYPTLKALFEVHCLSYELRLDRDIDDGALERAYELLETEAGAQVSYMVLAQTEMARAMLHQGKVREARAWTQRARALVEGTDTLDIASVEVLAGHVAKASNEPDAAQAAYTRAVRFFDARGLESHPRLIEPLVGLGGDATARARALAEQHGVNGVLP